MKVTLINAPSSFSYNSELSISYPLGLMYIAATLEEKGIAVNIIDFVNDQNVNTIKDVITKNNADIFGISALSDNRHAAFDIVNIIRKIHKNSKIVLGGIHPTIFYRQILDNIDADLIFLGESELSFSRYAINPEPAQAALKNIAGIAFRGNNGEIIVTERTWEECIDKIPKPAFHLIDLNRYKNRFNEIDFHLLTSRGCPFRCNFCSISAVHKGLYRTHSISRILEEMEMIQSFKKAGRIMLHDDFFAIDTKRTEGLCRSIIKRNIRLRWSVRSRVDRVNLSTLKLMRESGCEAIFFGVETGSPRILEAMNKNFSFKDVKKAFNLTKQSGIKVICNIMIGYPGEDKDSLRQTRNLLAVIKPDKVYFFPVKIFPGTKLYDECTRKGIIDDSFWVKSKNKVPIYHADIGYIDIFWNMYKMKMSLEKNFFKKLIITYKVLLKEFTLFYAGLFHKKG